MTRELRSAGNFDRKLANLFEALEGRERELQSGLDKLVKGLLDGSITKAAEHHLTDDTCCLPLIDDYVVVFRPDHGDEIERDQAGRSIVSFRNATKFDLLNIEKEERE